MLDLSEQITRAHEQDQQNAPVAELSSQLPITYESITPQWLTNVLCWGVIGAKVVDLKLGVPDNGNSNRRKIELTYNAKGQQAGLPAKLFCKATHGLANRLSMALTGCLESEVMFYKLIRPSVDIETPQSYFAAYDDYSYNSMVVLGDVSDQVESFCDHRTPINKARAESQMKLLAKIHSQFYQSQTLKDSLDTFSSLPIWPVKFTDAVQFGRMKDASRNGFSTAKEVIPARLYRQFEAVWPATLACVEQHYDLPRTVTHNDPHLKNWYVMPNDEVGLSDWQCCAWGHWSRDLAYTISTALTLENRRLWEKDLIQTYLDEMGKAGVRDTSFEQTWDLYRQQLLSVLTFWTVTLTPPEFMPEFQPQELSLEFVRRITTAMDDLDVLSLF